MVFCLKCFTHWIVICTAGVLASSPQIKPQGVARHKIIAKKPFEKTINKYVVHKRWNSIAFLCSSSCKVKHHQKMVICGSVKGFFINHWCAIIFWHQVKHSAYQRLENLIIRYIAVLSYLEILFFNHLSFYFSFVMFPQKWGSLLLFKSFSSFPNKNIVPFAQGNWVVCYNNKLQRAGIKRFERKVKKQNIEV